MAAPTTEPQSERPHRSPVRRRRHRGTQKPPFPGFLGAVGLLVAGMLLLGTLAIILSPMFAGLDDVVQLVLFHVIGLGFLVYVGWRLTRTPAQQVFPFRRFSLLLLLPMTLLLLGMHVVLSEVDNLTRLLIGPMPEGWNPFDGERITLAAVVAGVVVAPVTEELLFRGVILHGFRKRYPTTRAVWSCALLFALFHLNPWQLAGALIGGAILGWFLILTGSLWACLFGHALFNLLSAASTVLPPIPGYSTTPGPEVEFQPLALDLLGLAAAGAGFYWLWRATRGRDRGRVVTADENGDE